MFLDGPRSSLIRRGCRCYGSLAAWVGTWFLTFRDNLSRPSSRVNCLTLEDGTDWLSRNVGDWLMTYVTQWPRKASASTTPRRVTGTLLVVQGVEITRRVRTVCKAGWHRCCSLLQLRTQGSSVCVVTRLWAGWSGDRLPEEVRIVPIFRNVQPDLSHTQPPIRQVVGDLS
jgi:hypothetical protein